MKWTHQPTKDNTSSTQWADIILSAMADGETFSNLRMITLKSHYEDVISTSINIQELTVTSSDDKFLKQLDTKLQEAMNSGKYKVKQFVEYDEILNELTVCLDVESINDITYNRALDATLDVDMSKGKVEFGDSHTYTYNECYSNNKHNFNITKRIL